MSAGVVGGAVVDSPPGNQQRHAQQQRRATVRVMDIDRARAMCRVDLQFTNRRDNSVRTPGHDALADPARRVSASPGLYMSPTNQPLSLTRRRLGRASLR